MRASRLIPSFLAVAGAAALLASSPAFAAATGPYAGQKMAKRAHISIDKAQTIALKARAGTVTDRELEKEKGGSGLRYSFDITTADGAKWEVGVDAKTGKVLENAKEGPHPD